MDTSQFSQLIEVLEEHQHVEADEASSSCSCGAHMAGSWLSHEEHVAVEIARALRVA